MKANLNALKSVVQPLSHSHHITHELCTNVPEIYHISLIGTRGITGIKCSSPYAQEDSETRDEAEELCYAPLLGTKILAAVTSKLQVAHKPATASFILAPFCSKSQQL